MRHLTAIVAVNEDGAIGAGGVRPWRVNSADAFFERQTIGNIVIMGRRTFESFGHALADRDRIVISHGELPETERSAAGIAEALAKADLGKVKQQQVFVIGGENVFRQFAPFVDRYLIVDVYKPVPDADAFFDPDIVGDLSNWTISPIAEGEAGGDDEADFRIFELNARNPDAFRVRRSDAVEAHYALDESRRPPRFTDLR
jgi:dihydrofolate reductase